MTLRTAVVAGVVAVAAAACSNGPSTTSSATPETTSTSAATQATTSVGPTTTASTISTTPATETTETVTTVERSTTSQDPTVGAEAVFAITQVVFGEGAYAALQNIGGTTGTTTGLWLCASLEYAVVPELELEPGEVVALAIGASLPDLLDVAEIADLRDEIDHIRKETGELALYSSDAFDDPSAMVGYVEWGTSGHARSSVAAEAGIWPEGGFVAVPEEALALLAGGSAPAGPGDWIAEIGG